MIQAKNQKTKQQKKTKQKNTIASPGGGVQRAIPSAVAIDFLKCLISNKNLRLAKKPVNMNTLIRKKEQATQIAYVSDRMSYLTEKDFKIAHITSK